MSMSHSNTLPSMFRKMTSDSGGNRLPSAAWIAILISIITSVTGFAFSVGVQSQRISSLEAVVSSQQSQIMQTPAIMNELANIGRRLQNIESSISTISSRR